MSNQASNRVIPGRSVTGRRGAGGIIERVQQIGAIVQQVVHGPADRPKVQDVIGCRPHQGGTIALDFTLRFSPGIWWSGSRLHRLG